MILGFEIKPGLIPARLATFEIQGAAESLYGDSIRSTHTESVRESCQESLAYYLSRVILMQQDMLTHIHQSSKMPGGVVIIIE